MLVRSFIFILLLLPSAFYSQNWIPLGSGTNGQVTALTVYNGELIAGGSFTTAGGVPANNIAKWNGTSWSPLGSGIIGNVKALIVYNNELIAGGHFFTAGGVGANCIAKWNGSVWSPLGSGMNYYVTSFSVHNSDLVAGGFFTIAGGIPASAIARWNGNSWSAYGNGLPYIVNGVASINDSLFLGGNFFQTYRNTGKWTGAEWVPIAGGCNGAVHCMIKFGSDLIAGGVFSGAGSSVVNCIARWNGTSWSPLGSGMNQYINCLTATDSFFIAGGIFTTAGGTPANRIAKWKNTWQAMGEGFNNEVFALTVYAGEVIAGGQFTRSGSTDISFIGRFSELTPVEPVSSNIPEKFCLYQNYPNPFNPVTKIKFDLPGKNYTMLKIMDAAGREINTVISGELNPGTYEILWGSEKYSSGIYFVKIISGSFTDTKKMILLK